MGNDGSACCAVAEQRSIVRDAKGLCDRLSGLGSNGESDRLVVGFEERRDGFLEVVANYAGGRATLEALTNAFRSMIAYVMVVPDRYVDPFVERYLSKSLSVSQG